jgi:alpha-N-arabinofuranosidase
MAGIKFHGAIDVVISHNHIYRCGDVAGIWLDWMAQGAQVMGNLLHDNVGGCGDIFFEMQHGPILVANNLMLSKGSAFALNSQGVAFAYNLITGPIGNHCGDDRSTPYHPAHSTQLAGLYNARKGDSGDHRFYNNLFVAPCNLHALDNSVLPCFAAGNVFARGTQPSKFDANALLKPAFDPGLKLTEEPDGWYLELALDRAWATEQTRQSVTTGLLGKAKIPNLPFDNPDGSPIRIDTDYFGAKRNRANPFPGPVERPATGKQTFKVWPLPSH